MRLCYRSAVFIVLFSLTASCLIPFAAAEDSDKVQTLWQLYSGGDVAVSGDGQSIAVVTGNTLYLHDRAGNNPLWSYTALFPLTRVAISKDGQYIVAAGEVYIFLFDRNGASRWAQEQTNIGDRVRNVAISSDGSYVSFGSMGTSVYLFDRNGQLWQRAAPGLGSGMAVVSGSGRYVAAVNDRGICYYDRDVKNPLWQTQFGGRVTHLAISDDGKYVVAGSDDQKLYLYFFSNQRVWSQDFGSTFTCLAMTPDSQYIVACSKDAKLEVYGLDGKKVWGLQLPNMVNSVAISDSGNFVAAGTYDHLINFYDNNGNKLWVKVLENPVNKVSMSSDGSIVAAASDYNIVVFHSGTPIPARPATPTPEATPTPTPVPPTPPPDTATPMPGDQGSGAGLPMALIVGLGLGVIVVGTGGGMFLMARRHRGSQPSIEIQINGAIEDEEINGSVIVAADSPGATVTGVARLSGQIVRTIDGPGQTAVSMGRLQAGKYELTVECTVRDSGGKETRHAVARPFEVTEAVPKISIDASPLACSEGEPVRAKVMLTNISAHSAFFDAFVLDPGEAREITVDIDTSLAGKAEKKLTASYKNRSGRNFTSEGVIRYTVHSAAPDITAVIEPLEVGQGEKGLVKVTLTNNSDNVALFDTFTLKKGESHVIEYLVEGKAPGDAVAMMTLSYGNLVGRRFEKQIPVKYTIYAIEPVLELRVESVEVSGKEGFLVVSMTNQTPHEAFFDGFTLKFGESRPLRIPITDVAPGRHKQRMKVTCRNRNGRIFSRDMLLTYEVKRESDALPGKSAAAAVQMPARQVFISHAHQDKPVADAISQALEGQGISCWIAPRDVTPGMPFEESIMEGIGMVSIMVLVYSSRSNNSKHVQNEVREAWKRGIPIIPFRIDDVPMSDIMSYYLSSMHWIDALTPQMNSHTESLAGTVRMLLKNHGE